MAMVRPITMMLALHATLGYLPAGPMMEANQLLRPQCSHGVGASLTVAELDLGHGGSQQFNDSPGLAANEPLVGHIPQHGYLAKNPNFAMLPSTQQTHFDADIQFLPNPVSRVNRYAEKHAQRKARAIP